MNLSRKIAQVFSLKAFTLKSQMKSMLFIFFFSIGINGYSQALSVGDVAVIGINCDPGTSLSRTFTIVALADLSAGQIIKFSDKAYYSNAFSALLGNGSEGIFSWTIPSGGVGKGTVIMFTITSGATPSVTTTPSTGTTTVIEGWTSISPLTTPFGQNGDDILIYQGLESNPTFIFGFNCGNNTTGVTNGWNTGLTLNPNGACELPSTLTEGSNAVGFGGPAHIDNFKYNGIQTGTKAAILSAIADRTKWISDDVNEYNFTPGSGVFSGAQPIFTITSGNVAPTDISLSSNSVNENVAANTIVGSFSSTDADAGNTFTYTLVSGTGSTDNASFNINGNSLRIANSPDFESTSSYSIRIRTTDQGGLTFEKAFTISVNNVVELASITIQPVADSKCEGLTATFSVTATNVNSYQWQESTNGVNFSNIVDAGFYSGTSTSELTLTGITTVFNNHKFRCVLTNFDGSINTNEVLLTVVSTPTADSPSDVSVCDSYTLPALTIGNYFTEANGAGTALTAGDAIATSQTIYVYAANGTCTDENSFDVIITTTPTADSPSDVSVCDSYTLPALTVGNYFTAANGAGTALTAGDAITSTQTIYVYASNGSCTNENSFDVTITTTPTADSPSDVSVCDSYTLPALTVGNYFTGANGTGTALTTGDAITSTQTIYVYASNGTCTDENSFDITITNSPTADAPGDVSVCDSYTLPALTVGNYFTEANGTGTALTAGDVITTSQTIYVYAANGSCSDENSFDVTITATPDITSTLGDWSCSTATLTLEAIPTGGTINWFNAPTGGTSLFTGTSFITPSIASTTTYYAEVSNGTCVNATRVAVVATIGGCTQIRAIQCGSTVSNGNELVWASQVVGATNYKFEITDPSNNVIELENANRNFKFSQFVFANNTNYNVKVAAKVGGVYSPYGSTCEVRFEFQSKIQSSQCGATITSKQTQIWASAVTGATAYRFEITDPSNNITYVENTARTFTFSQFASVNNTTYTVRVSAKTGSFYASYGASCSVRLEQAVKIQASQCGVQIATPTITVWAPSVPGATGYRFELTDQSSNVTILDNPSRNFKFNQFAYTPGEVYSVRVSAKTGSYNAIYGGACNITAPSTGARQEEVVELKSMNEPTFDFEAFPNPSNGDFTISASEVGTFNIINELGQLVRTVEITEANGNQVKVENMPNGAYFVTGTLNGEVVTKKVMVVR